MTKINPYKFWSLKTWLDYLTYYWLELSSSVLGLNYVKFLCGHTICLVFWKLNFDWKIKLPMSECGCPAPSSLWLIPCKENVVWIPEVSYKVSSVKSVIIYWIINNYLRFGYPAPSSPWLIPWIDCLWIPIILRQLFCSNKDVRQGRGSVAGWGLVAKRGGFVTSQLMRARGLRLVT